MWIRRLVAILLPVLLVSCSHFNPNIEEPTVSVTAFRLDYPQSLHPQFLIDLHVVNPNSRPIELNGLAYSASIEGHKVLAGANNALPVIDAYSEGDITLTASPDFLGGLRLIQDLLQRQRGQLQYQLSIKLDVKGWIVPITLEETGSIGVATRRF